MTKQQIAADIARGIEIKAQLERLEVELAAIEKRLQQAGLSGEQVPLKDADREGKQYLAEGAKVIVPVRFESDLIAGSFPPDSEMHKAVVSALGDEHKDKIVHFFKDTRTFQRVPKDGQAFRKIARELLDGTTFAKLISASTQRNNAGIPKSKIVVAWDDAKPLDQVAQS